MTVGSIPLEARHARDHRPDAARATAQPTGSADSQAIWRTRGIAAMQRLDGTAFVLVDDAFVIRWASDSFQRIFRVDPVGRLATEFVHPEDLGFAVATIAHHSEYADRYIDNKRIDEIVPASAQMRLLDVDGRALICTLSIENRITDPSIASMVIRIDRRPDRTSMARALELMSSAAPATESLACLADFIVQDADNAISHQVYIVWWDSNGTHAVNADGPVDIDHPLIEPMIYRDSLDELKLKQRIFSSESPLPSDRVALQHGFTNCITVPIISQQNSPLGAIILWTSNGFEYTLAPEMHLTIGQHLARVVLVERSRLEGLELTARTDYLTGLGNRAHFDQMLRTLSESEDSFPFGVIIFDLDGFKKVNDTLGHNAGDIVLQTIASRLREISEPGDTVVRLGGDEFAILRPAINLETTDQLTPQFQSSFEQPIAIEHPAKPTVTVTVGTSMGVAIARRRVDVIDVLANADAALYEMKRKQQRRSSDLRAQA